MSEIWFTSDTHFGHEAILKHSARPFDTVKEMYECIIENWRARVKPGDRIYHLGDFAFCRPERLVKIVRQLTGNLHFIHGNHDKGTDKVLAGYVAWQGKYMELKIPDAALHPHKRKIVLFHFPIESWNCRHHDAWHLHGHCHGQLPSPDWQPRVDVGVDVWNMAPVSYQEIREHMRTKHFRAIDHHGRERA